MSGGPILGGGDTVHYDNGLHYSLIPRPTFLLHAPWPLKNRIWVFSLGKLGPICHINQIECFDRWLGWKFPWQHAINTDNVTFKFAKNRV